MNLFIPENSKSSSFKVKRSKFISYLKRCDSPIEFKSWLSQVRVDHYDSSHVCWGYAIYRYNEIQYHSSDAGEPKGTAGIPILNLLKASNLIQSGLIIVRYFGGSKLGKKGLTDAYSFAAKNVLDLVKLAKWSNRSRYLLTCPMEYYGEIYSILSKVGGNIIEHQSTNQSQWLVEIQINRISDFIQTVRNITKGKGDIKKIV